MTTVFLILIFLLLLVAFLYMRSTLCRFYHWHRYPVQRTKQVTSSCCDTHTLTIMTLNLEHLPFYSARYNQERTCGIVKLIAGMKPRPDVVCFQEAWDAAAFQTLHRRLACLGYHWCISPHSHRQLAQSGLAIFASQKLKFIQFGRFRQRQSYDKLARKGWCRFKIHSWTGINCHLPAHGIIEEPNLSSQAMRQIRNDDDVCEVIVGDFNIDRCSRVYSRAIKKYYLNAAPFVPTHSSSVCIDHILLPLQKHNTNRIVQAGHIKLIRRNLSDHDAVWATLRKGRHLQHFLDSTSCHTKQNPFMQGIK